MPIEDIFDLRKIKKNRCLFGICKSSSYMKSVIRHYTKFSKSIDDYCESAKKIINFAYRYKAYSIRILTHNTVWFPELIKRLYKENSSWEIGPKIGLNQRRVSPIVKELGLTRKHISKTHERMKPLIEEVLKTKTITDYQALSFRIDEYDPIRNLGIEIDGNWCHYEIYDEVRDAIIFNNLNIRIVRIPAFTEDINDIKEYLKDFI